MLQTRSEAFVKYLAALAELKPLIEIEPADRLRMFQQHFGDDSIALETEFLRYMRSVN